MPIPGPRRATPASAHDLQLLADSGLLRALGRVKAATASAALTGDWRGEGTWRVHVEYADTTCGFYESEPQYGCAYRNTIYTDGYQYLDRGIGHAEDGDSRQWAGGAMWVNGDGSSWEIAAHHAKLNRAGANQVHTITPVPLELRSADVYHRRDLFGGDLKLGLGYEQRESDQPGMDEDDMRGFAQWARQF